MKKLIALVLVLTLVLSIGALAFAVDPIVYEDSSKVTIDKRLTLTNEGTVNPEETFSFTIGAGTGERDGVSITAPVFNPDIFTIEVLEGAAQGSTDITLPKFTQVGVYTYPVTETTGTTAGMRYDSVEYYLAVTVIKAPEGDEFIRVLTLVDENGIKNDAFKNEYSAGDLTVYKVIDGNYADPNDEFEITVTVTPEAGKVINAETISWNTAAANVSGPNSDGVYTATYTLKGGESFTIENLPYNVTYEVEETNSGEYVVTYDNNKLGEFNAATIGTTITNTRNTVIETGINLDNLPYVLILVGAAAGLVAFTIKRRPSSDE